MKQHIILFALLFGTLFFVSQPALAQTSITIHFHDGTEQLVSVSESGKFAFDENNLLITTTASNSPISIPISTLRKIILNNDVSLTDYSKKDNITIYPNPARTYVRIAGLETPSTVKVFSMSGQLMFEKQCVADEQIDISSLTAGLYFINVNNNTIKCIKL